MGLIQAALGSAGGVLADSWREYFYCESLGADVLAAKGQTRTSNRGRSSNTKRDENIISNGSIVAVADGQCMIIVEQGEIVEFCAEPGEFTWDTSKEPSIFYGDLGETAKSSIGEMVKRFGFGGDTAMDQRVYYFNTKEIMGNKYGTTTPIPFRVVDGNIGLDLDSAVRMNGIYSYRITNPILFYKNVCGNVKDVYTRKQFDEQLRSEILTALQPALARISGMGIRYSAVPAHTTELAQILNDEMSADWRDLRGIEIVKFGVNSISLNPDDEERIKSLQSAAVMRDPNMAAANIAAAQSDAMRAAAANEGGAMNGFIGMNMAGMTGGMNAASLFAQGGGGVAGPPQSQYNMAQGGGFAPPTGAPVQNAAPAPAAAGGWTCACGATNTGKFCGNCGQPQPAPVAAASWTCSCGATNEGKFCGNCGQPRPVSDEWTCACGAVNKGKFCGNCGQPRG